MNTPEHNLQKVIEQMNPANEPPEVKARLSKIMITLNFDLRGIDSKVNKLADTPLCTGWMIFLNAAGTLAHIMHAEDVSTGSYVRMRVGQTYKGSLKNAHPDYIRRWFYNRMVDRYVI